MTVAENSPRGAPRASVIIPTCNRRDTLSGCLAALAAQTDRSFEIVVVDDHSTDGTPGMLEDFAARHPEIAIRWLHNDQHAGANVSRNRGVHAARGEIVAFLDSDCIAAPDWLNKLLTGFTSERVAAVTGRVTEPPPANIYELALAGTARVHGSGPATRLVGGNMAVRRKILLRYGFDEDPRWKSALTNGIAASPVCDEESLYLTLRAAGYELRVIPDAVVCHEHRYDRAAFIRQALAGGRAAAYLVHKYYLPPRLDLLPWMLTYLTLPLASWHWKAAIVPAVILVAAFAALAYNEIARKGKSIFQLLQCLLVLVFYYHLRLLAYVVETLRLKLGRRDVRRVRLRGLP